MFNDSDTITSFGPPVLVLKCAICNRHGEYKVHNAVRRYGAEITVADWKKRVAQERGCERAAEDSCMAVVHKTSVTWWARISHAERGGWRPVLRCLRRHFALKRVHACPPLELDLRTLVASHGSQCKLERLERWAKCPQCGSDSATIEWVLPGEQAPDMLIPKKVVGQ